MAGGGLVLLVALGTIFLGIYQINVYIILLAQQTKWLPLMIAIAGFTNAGINLVLTPKVGIIGAAISTIVSYFILAAIVTFWVRKSIGYRVDFKFIAKVLLATVIMGVCVRFIPTSGALGVATAVIASAAIYALGVFLSKAFSKEDIRLIREALSGLKPHSAKGRYLEP